MKVIKRDGKEEIFDFNKIQKMFNFCKQGLNIDEKRFWKEFHLEIFSGITTKQIQQTLINTANKLSIEDLSRVKEYSILANRFFLLDWIKEFKLHRENEYKTMTDDYGFFRNAEDWIKHLKKYVELGVYDERIFEVPQRILKKLYVFAKKVQLDYEYNFSYFMWNNFYYQTVKFAKSYIIQYENKPVENFAEVLLLISILGFLPDRRNEEKYVEYVKTFYKYLLDYLVIPATPQLANLRKADGNLSSCNILDIHDNLESIMYSYWQIAEISKKGGGIGIYLGRIRPEGSYIRGNKGKTNNVLSWVKIIDDILEAVNQLGVRKGAGTIALPIWHMDILDFMGIRNPIGEIRFKSFAVYPQVIIPDLFMKRVEKDEDWTLIDHYELKQKYGIDLIEVWGKEFEENYLKAEKLVNEDKVRGKKIRAREVYRQLIKNILASGMPYIFFEDNANNQSMFKEKLVCANLCMENYSPFRNTNPEKKKPNEEFKDIGYIHSCNLISLHLPNLYEKGYLSDNKKLQGLMDLVIRYMDNILDITVYPLKEVERHNKEYRTIGIGFVGLADLMVKYSLDNNDLIAYRFTSRKIDKDKVLKFIDDIFSKIYETGIKASEKLAKERGEASELKNTEWNRKLRNTMLFNCPPNTSTSIYAGTTASIFPPFNLIQTEKHQNGVYITFPKYLQEGYWYYDEYSKFNEQDMVDMIEIVAEIQKYIDSGISFEYPMNIRDGIIDKNEAPRVLGKFIYEAWKKGIKTLYYCRVVAKNKDECISCAN